MTAWLFFAILLLVTTAPLSSQTPAGPATERQADYVVGAQDVLIITSYDQDDLSGRFVVETDGSFTFPLVGRLAAGGLTLRQVEGLLKAQLVDGGFFRNPEITVTVDEYRSQKIYVLGEVRRPGVYPLSGVMRLVEALATADSTLPTAGPEIVIIPAADPAAPQEGDDPQDDASRVTRVSLNDLQNGDARQNVVLRDGDTILVPRAEEVYVFGEVRNPGAYPLRQEDTTVLQALSLAGGLTDRGATGRIEIVRIVDGEKVEVSAELTDMVLPGDTVVVPQRFF